MTEQQYFERKGGGLGEAKLSIQQQRDILVRLGINLSFVKEDSVSLTSTGDGLILGFTYMARIDPKSVADLL